MCVRLLGEVSAHWVRIAVQNIRAKSFQASVVFADENRTPSFHRFTPIVSNHACTLFGWRPECPFSSVDTDGPTEEKVTAEGGI